MGGSNTHHLPKSAPGRSPPERARSPWRRAREAGRTSASGVLWPCTFLWPPRRLSRNRIA